MLRILRARYHRFFIKPLIVATLAAPALLPASRSIAQDVDCTQLRRDLAAAGRGDPSRVGQFARAAERQRNELISTQNYAAQIGCNNRQFLFFGEAPPPQCDAIEAQIARMQNNFATLDAESRRMQGGDAGRQAYLASRYENYCRNTDQNTADLFGVRGGFDDGTGNPDGMDDTQQPVPETRPRGGSKSICVRTCDGGFFPLPFSANASQLDGLQSLCSALCPNTEAKLYTTSDTDNVDGAIDADGTPYTELPTAFKFQKSFDATCACKPPNKSWVEALAQAEQLLGKSQRTDVTVTAKMSNDMAKPAAAAVPGPDKRKPSKIDKAALVDVQAEAEGALGAQAPTAGSASAGIAVGTVGIDRLVREGEGPVKELQGPDGLKRRVRIIEPAL